MQRLPPLGIEKTDGAEGGPVDFFRMGMTMRLILNRDFKLPDDGWYHIAPLGEFLNADAGVMQVIDQEACAAMAARFATDAAAANFPGLLIDFDHFSLVSSQRSEAAGWILGLEARAGSGKRQAAGEEPTPCPSKEGSKIADQDQDGAPGGHALPKQGEGGNAGLWAQIRWSDLGEEAVKGGRYRFLSPVWARRDCVELGFDLAGHPRVRPIRMENAAVTNEPGLRGMVPLSNRIQNPEVRIQNGNAGKGETADERRPAQIRSGGSVDFSGMGNKAGERGEKHIMKAVIDRLLNHLGLEADAVEAVVLEKLALLPTLSAATVLQNSLTQAQEERDVLKGTLKTVEGELVNRHLAEFEGVVTEKTKGFWTEQLISNRAGALTALTELATLRDAGSGETAGGKREEVPQTKKPLHNRGAVKVVPPGIGGDGPSTGSGSADGRAVKIRNRAQEISAAEKVPFGVAFRRAERELAG
jgi:hypothetical protein